MENNYVKNYGEIVNQFANVMNSKPEIKKTLLCVFANPGSITERISSFITTEKNKALHDAFINAKGSFVSATINRLSAKDHFLITNLLNKQDDYNKIVVIDAYTNKSINNMFEEVMNEIKILRENLKYIKAINENVSIYVLGLPKIENQTSNIMKLKYATFDFLYESIIKNYSNVEYVPTTTSRKEFDILTNGEAYKQIGCLLDAINTTYPTHERTTKLVSAKENMVLLEPKVSKKEREENIAFALNQSKNLYMTKKREYFN